MNNSISRDDCWRPPSSTMPPSLPDNPAARASDFAHMASAMAGEAPAACANGSVEGCYQAYRRENRRPLATDDCAHHHPETKGQPQASSENAAFARLRLVFEWLLHQVVTRMTALNDALQGNGDYATAEREYNQFVDRLVGRDPDVYGNLVKRIHKLEPTIRNGRIEGVTLVVEWNPHSSSSMVHP